jgi:hypothetical protein
MQELRVGVPHNLRGDVPDGSPPQGAANGLPPELSALLRARDDVSRERAWEQFLEKYSRLLLHTVRTRSGTYYEAVAPESSHRSGQLVARGVLTRKE